jgi:hypothetical protein
MPRRKYDKVETDQKPTLVRVAVILLYIFWGVNMLVLVGLSIINKRPNISLPSIFVFLSIGLIYLISIGKSWARNLLLVFFILGMCSSLVLLPVISTAMRYQIVISVLNYALGIIPLILLFLKPSRQWFKSFK